jgi:glutaredoxin 3
MSDKKVIVYSTPTCPYCVYAKTFFKQNEIPFEDVDVSKDRERATEMVNKSGQMGVPVIDIDGEILIGYQPEKFSELLNLK